MHEVRLTQGPIGPVRLDEYGTPILDIHIRKVARVNGKLTNTTVKTYPQVSQFWTYDPKKFIEQPVFSRLPSEPKPRIAKVQTGRHLRRLPFGLRAARSILKSKVG